MPLSPITRSLTFTLGLCGCSLCAAEPQSDPPTAMQLDTTHVDASGLGNTTEHTGAYTTGAMSTATRLNLSIRDTPQSVSVITRQHMDDFKLDTLSTVLGQVTGVTVQHLDSDRMSYSTRGYAINNFQIDGMLNTFSYMKSDADTIIYDRIEVVRGATGLTTGAGDPSGTVNMLRKRPGPLVQVQTGISAGSYDNYYGYLDVGGPVAFDGRLRARTVLAQRDSHSFRDHYALQRSVGYGILEADLSDDTVLALGYDYQDKHVQGSAWGTTPYWNAQGGKARLPRSTNLTAPWSSWPWRDRTRFATLDQGLAGDWHLKAAYTRRDSDTDGKMYYSGAGFPDADGSGMRAYINHFVGEQRMDAYDLNLAGPYRLFGREHELLLGYGEARRRDTEPFVRRQLPAGYNEVDDWRDMGSVDKFYDEVTGLTGYDDTQRQKAGYLATRLSLTDRLHAVLGSRYGSWSVSNRKATYDTSDRVLTSSHGQQHHNAVLSPYAGLLYDLDQAYTVYVSYTDIFKPQNARDVSGTYLEPVVGSNYELGLKGSLLDERLNLSSAIFYSKQDNVAEPDYASPPDPKTGRPYSKSGGKGNTVRGFEVELAGQPLEHWNLSAGYSYTHALNAQQQRSDGSKPLNLLRLSSSYRLPGQWQRLTVGGAVNWQSAIAANSKRPTFKNGPTETAKISQGAYAVINLMTRYTLDARLSAALNVNNLLDTRYYESVGFSNGIYWGEPRSLTLSLDWKI